MQREVKADSLPLRTAVRPALGHSRSRTIWSLEEGNHLEYISGRIADPTLYEHILNVRNRTDERWPDQSTPVDGHSDLYCMYVNGAPVGCLGVTRALDGDLFLHEYCPPPLLDRFGDALVSAYRFRILAEYRRSSSIVPGVYLSRHMVREAWREQIAKGAGIDVINIERALVKLYERMGYVLCEGYDYIDPVLGTESCLMFLPVDPDRPSVIQDIIRQNDLRVSLGDVLACLSRKQVYVSAGGA